MRTIKINKILIISGLIGASLTLDAATYRSSKSSEINTRIRNAASPENTKNTTSDEIIIPKGLKPGDTIGLIAPANYTNENSNAEVEYLKSRGFNVVYGQSFYSKWYGFGGTDNVRAKDINDMFANPNINAIFAVRGGYGGIRIVDKINYDVI